MITFHQPFSRLNSIEQLLTFTFCWFLFAEDIKEVEVVNTPDGSVSLCKTISKIKLPHLSIIIIDKSMTIYCNCKEKIFYRNNQQRLRGQGMM